MGEKITQTFTYEKSDKSFGLTFVFLVFFGGLGIHRFYNGKIGTGLLYLFTLGLFQIGVIYDIITLLFGKFTDKEGAILINTNEGIDKVVNILCLVYVMFWIVGLITGISFFR